MMTLLFGFMLTLSAIMVINTLIDRRRFGVRPVYVRCTSGAQQIRGQK